MRRDGRPSCLDPRLTFETFVVGPANRLARRAASRVAEAPASTYNNPLILYGAPGLGKTHLLMAIGNSAMQREPPHAVRYVSTRWLLEAATTGGAVNDLSDALRDVRWLLLDDLQLLRRRVDAQAALAVAWDAIVSARGQIALASDRPTRDIDGFDDVLGSRCVGGLVADLAPLGYETRLRIVQARVVEQERSLADGVADMLAQLAFGSVRELQAGLNRVLAAQALEGRLLRASEVPELLAIEPASARHDEFGAFLHEVSGAVGEVLRRHSPEQRLAQAIMHWEGDGFRTARLEAGLAGGSTADEVDRLIASFEADVARLRRLGDEIRKLDASAPELARADVLLDPDRVDAAERLVARVRDRLSHPAAARQSRDDRAATAMIDGGADDTATARAAAVPEVGVVDRWFLSPEKVVWRWPYVEDGIVTTDE